MKKIKQSLRSRLKLLSALSKNDELLSLIHQVGELLETAIREGSIILICGNGGSAAEAQHMAGEIAGRYLVEREGQPALSLAADTATLTAIGNDYGYDQVFARQVTAYRKLARVLLLFSTSGNSPNLVKAALKARSCGITTVGLLGRDGGALRPLCDYAIVIPSRSTPCIQEMHLTIIHILCGYVDGASR